jgi:hypothetical protein
MTRVAVADLVPATQYKVQVRAVSDGEYSGWSESFTFNTTQNSTIPAAPATVTWVVVGDGFAGTWTEVTQDISGAAAIIDSYELELTAGATTKVQVVQAQRGQDGIYNLDFQGNIALFGTPKPSISFRVRAVNNKGIKGNWSGSVNASNPVPADVTGFTANGQQSLVALTWTANPDTDLDHYEIFTGTTSGFTPTSVNRIFSGNVTSYNYGTTTYSLQFFKIRAIDKFGQASANDSVASATPTSPFGVDTTAPATPTGLAATITTLPTSTLATSAAVSWTANGETDLAGYFLRYRVSGTTPWNTVRYDKSTTSAVINNLTPYVDYEFQIAAVDWTENMSSYSATATGLATVNSAPSTPTAPTVSTNTLQAQITIPGTKAAGGAMETDVVYYEVYGSTTTGFTPGPTNMLGAVPVGPAMVSTFDIPASGGGSTQTWFFKIVAVDNGGLRSTASAQATGTPGLIQGTNITNATITNAKISDLAADKLTAGTGIINNLSVKSILTVGDATTTGSLQSFDYVAGTNGYKIASVGGTASLEINKGTIRAPALLIQQGNNIAANGFTDFEYASSYYPVTWPVNTSGGFTVALSTAQTVFNTHSLLLTNTSGALRVAYLGQTTTDYNIKLDPSTTYLLSCYLYNNTPGTAATVNARIINQAGTALAVSTQNLVNATGWNRYTWVITTDSATTSGIITITNNAAANGATSTFYVDGVQLEQQLTSAQTPSRWTPPGQTAISGYQIQTGAIQSTATTVVNGSTIPVWSIPLNGSASFANVQVRGSAVIGVAGSTDGAASTLSSGNFVAGTTGYQLKSDGSAEFHNVSVSATGASGSRITIGPDTTLSETIKFYGDGTENAAGYIRSTANSTFGSLELFAPAAVGGSPAGIGLNTFPSSTSRKDDAYLDSISITADMVNLIGMPVTRSNLQNAAIGVKTTDMTIADTTVTTVSYGSMTELTGFTNSSGAFQMTVRDAGIFMVSAGVTWDDPSSVGRRQIGVYVNGTAVRIEAISAAASSTNFGQHISWVGELFYHDTVSIRVYQNSGSSITLWGTGSTAGWPYIGIVRVV